MALTAAASATGGATGRCWWVPADDLLYRNYHDTEWGFPQANDTRLFEKLCLEGFQAGLSWRTVLGKRERFREAFAGFDIAAVAGFGEAEVGWMLADSGLIRHRGKITAAIANAAVAQRLQADFGSLAAYVWRYQPLAHPADYSVEAVKQRTTSPAATRLAADLRARGWRFLGPTSAYAFAQAMGMVNDHVEGCPVRAQATAARAAFRVPSGLVP